MKRALLTLIMVLISIQVTHGTAIYIPPTPVQDPRVSAKQARLNEEFALKQEEITVFRDYNDMLITLLDVNSTCSDGVCSGVEVEISVDGEWYRLSEGENINIGLPTIRILRAEEIEGETHVTFVVGGKADLAVDKIDYWFDNDTSPTRIYYNVTVKNIGDIETTDWVNNGVRIGLSHGDMGSSCPPLSPGETSHLLGYGWKCCTDDPVISGTADDEYLVEIEVKLDDLDEVDEANETNNMRSIMLSIGENGEFTEETLDCSKYTKNECNDWRRRDYSMCWWRDECGCVSRWWGCDVRLCEGLAQNECEYGTNWGNCHWCGGYGCQPSYRNFDSCPGKGEKPDFVVQTARFGFEDYENMTMFEANVTIANVGNVSSKRSNAYIEIQGMGSASYSHTCSEMRIGEGCTWRFHLSKWESTGQGYRSVSFREIFGDEVNVTVGVNSEDITYGRIGKIDEANDDNNIIVTTLPLDEMEGVYEAVSEYGSFVHEIPEERLVPPENMEQYQENASQTTTQGTSQGGGGIFEPIINFFRSIMRFLFGG